MDYKSKHIERVRKLLALSASSNENEAKVALQRAEKIMEKYAISYIDLGKAESGTGIFVTNSKTRDKWKVNLYGSIGYILGCASIFRINENQKMAITFYGKKPNIEMAIYLCEVVTHAVNTQWKKYRKDNDIASDAYHRNRFYLSFSEGISRTIVDMFQGMASCEQNAHKSEVNKAHLQIKSHIQPIGSYQSRRHPSHAATAGYKAGRTQPIFLGVNNSNSSGNHLKN